MEVQTKVCTKCGVEKELGEFARNKLGRLGCQARCKQCRREESRNWHTRNRERVLARKRELYIANKGKADGLCAKPQHNVDLVKKRASKLRWYHKNKDYLHAAKKHARDDGVEWYIRQRLGVANPTPELIELKRQQLMLHRATKQLKDAIKGIENGNG